ncbi:PEP/pyruvate-binding domain-containing protein [Syntrophorhabdus aromaticivorans]|uniref:PEP/pyruvate-binding domain-containing protein n=1 Tax=Syntrophorhabdus aromaticivorans TaxID=328301 RepID=UPI00049069E7|nr:PEP/pyruvate-binding domain-containing protein [Syntrophorhabdus aromaticivorans]
MEKWLFWFDEIDKDSSELVGKKCANLGEMSRLGMRVPHGFAISVKGFEQFMSLTGLAQEVEAYIGAQREDLKQVEVCQAVSRKVQGLIESTPVPESMKKEISAYYHALCDKVGRKNLAVAVRSSGVVSMPGQMDTYLNVVGEEAVTEHIKRVWSSSYTVRAMTCRIEQEMPVEWAPIGVAVMMLVDAKSAGVVLTVLPTTGDMTKVVIEGNWGLGESVVGGEITPDSFVVDKENLTVLDRKVSTKQGMVGRETSGTTYVKVPKELQGESCLDDEEIREITKTAIDVEKHFGVPQDMEWVVDKDLPFPENIFWVQARPARFTKVEKAEDIDYIIDLMVRIFD